MQQRGWDVTYLPVAKDGLIRLEQLEAAMRPDTALVSIMYVNNEIGARLPCLGLGCSWELLHAHVGCHLGPSMRCQRCANRSWLMLYGVCCLIDTANSSIVRHARLLDHAPQLRTTLTLDVSAGLLSEAVWESIHLLLREQVWCSPWRRSANSAAGTRCSSTRTRRRPLGRCGRKNIPSRLLCSLSNQVVSHQPPPAALLHTGGEKTEGPQI